MKLQLKSVSASAGGKKIIDGINLEINSGELHVLMGPNGSGKSTLASVIIGNSAFVIDRKSTLKMDGKDITGLTVEERARKGLFLGYQNPVAVPGVTVTSILKEAITEKIGRKGKTAESNPFLTIWDLNKLILQESVGLGISREFLRRGLNDNFSGGEKKKMEILQALILQPNFAIFDEIDTGLDVDALKLVAEAIKRLKEKGSGVILITHYQRIMKYLSADKVYVMVNGRIVKSGKHDLVGKIEDYGYKEWTGK